MNEKPLTICHAPRAEKTLATGDWWKSNKSVYKDGTRIWQFDNGYRVEKFTLNEKDLARHGPEPERLVYLGKEVVALFLREDNVGLRTQRLRAVLERGVW
jgi:hypothetical protein